MAITALPRPRREPAAGLAGSLVLASLSRALDLAEGEPMGHAIRTCWLGMRVGEWIGLGRVERHNLYYTLLLKDVGCSANAYSVARWFGADDRTTKAELKVTDWNNQWRSLLVTMRQAAPAAPITRRMAQMVSLRTKGSGLVSELIQARSERGAELMLRLGWDRDAAAAVAALDEHWDGSGYPRRLKGDQIPVLARIALLAQTVEILWRRGGARAAEAMLRQRRGRWFDPKLVDTLLGHAREDRLWTELGTISDPEHIASLNHVPYQLSLESLDEIIRVAEVFASVVDAKSPWMATHSARTAAVARFAAERMGFSDSEQDRIGLAGLLHDLGKLAISNSILDKAGPLLPEEMEAMQRHPAITHEILAPLWPLDDVVEMAAAHHERLDGSGYHRHLRGPDMPFGANLLAVADVFDALTTDRPYRRAMTLDQAMAELRTEQGLRLAAEPIEALGELLTTHRPELAPAPSAT